MPLRGLRASILLATLACTAGIACMACKGSEVRELPSDAASGDGDVDAPSGVDDGSERGGIDAQEPRDAGDSSVDADAIPDARADATGLDVSDSPDSDHALGARCGVHPGPRMVEVAAFKPFCIDAYEVTMKQYKDFAASPSKPKQPPFCTWNLGYGPMSSRADDLPASGIDWCDAYEYCAWAGKKLCGSIAGGAPLTNDTPSVNQWTFACTGGDPGTKYPYGASFIGGRCNVDTSKPSTVGGNPDCHGSGARFGRIFDMSGNVREWDMTCDDPLAGPVDAGSVSCGTRGGGYSTDGPSAACVNGQQWGISNLNETVGVRCCLSL